MKATRLLFPALALLGSSLASWIHAETIVQLRQVGRWSPADHAFWDIQNSGHFIYAATAGNGWFIIDASNPSNLQVIKTNRAAPQLDVYGLTVAGSRLIVCTLNTAYRYDITNPADPVIQNNFSSLGSYVRDAEIHHGVTYIPGFVSINFYGSVGFPPAISLAVSDLHSAGDYLFASGDQRLYVLEQMPDVRLQIVGELATPTPFSGSGPGVRVSGASALLAGGGLAIVDVTDPAKPRLQSSSFQNYGMASLELQEQRAYIASGTHGVHVVDFSDPDNPKMLGHFDTAGTAHELSLNGDFIYVADSTNGVLVLQQTILEVSPLTIQSAPPEMLVLTAGQTLELAVEATATLPITYQWTKSGEPLDVSGPTLVIENVNRSHEGAYSLTVTDGNSTHQFQTSLRVLGNLALAISSGFPLTVSVTDPFAPVNPGSLVLETSPNLLDWFTLPLPSLEQNGSVQFTVEYNPDVPSRFFRVAEQP